MRSRSKLLFVGLGASLLMTFAVSAASARNLSVNENGLGMTWSNARIITAAGTAECPVTLRGSFHRRTFTKTAGLLVGAINGVTIGTRCTGGSATVLRASLPWHFRYVSFSGTLPRIASVTYSLIGAAIAATIAGVECLARSEVAQPMRFIESIGASGEMRTATFDRSATIDLEDESFLCAIGGAASLEGTGNIDGNVVEPIVIRLIA